LETVTPYPPDDWAIVVGDRVRVAEVAPGIGMLLVVHWKDRGAVPLAWTVKLAEPPASSVFVPVPGKTVMVGAVVLVPYRNLELWIAIALADKALV
jgi:hypothetical protein